MPLFSDTDMQGFADLASDLALKDDCDILVENDTTDPLGGGSSPSYTVTATVKCMVVDFRAPSQEYEIANQVVGRALKKVSTPLGTSILKSDLLRIKNVAYRVVEPLGLSSYAVFSEAVVVETTLS